MTRGGIKAWPEDERPREKLLQRGAGALTDAELIAIMLRTGDAAKGRTALDLGRELLCRFGTLHELAQASVAEICDLPGTGPVKAATILAAFELGRRHAGSQLRFGQDRFTAPEQIFQHYQHQMRSLRKEQVHILLLDSKNRILREVLVSAGSLTQSIVHPREVFTQAVRDSAAAIILVHNHPSGDPTPSREDLEITRRLKEAGELLGIRLLDHVIIGDGTFVSLSAQGLL
jgi:DNA repair protein RadC